MRWTKEMLRVKQRTSFYSAAALLLCTVLALSGTTGQADNISSTCALKCEVSPGKTEAKCTLPADPQKLNCSRQDYANILRNVSSLDLSDNELTEVPTWMFPDCGHLTELSLARNNINHIELEAFAPLVNLILLNLSFNDLRDWEVNPVNELQVLNYLDVTGNQHWLPSQQLLQLSNLTTVKGVRLSRYCQDCSLVKDPGYSADELVLYWIDDEFSSESQLEWQNNIQYGKALDFVKLGFWPTCLFDDACYIEQHSLPFAKAVYDVTIKASFALYATGSVALLVNIAVVVFIVFNKSLRADLTVRLILNIAVCDVLIGMVTVLYARFHVDNIVMRSLQDFLQENHSGASYDYTSEWKKLQNIMGPILTCAVTSQVFGSCILMLEKFLKIVFAMRPDVRIGRKTALLLSLLSWLLSGTFAVLPVFEVGNMTYTEQYSLTPLPADIFADGKYSIGFAAASQIALLVIQLASFVLYVPIVIVVRKSGANVGIKREGTLARKIALLVFTNLIFFTVPFVVGAFQNQIVDKTSLFKYTFVEYQWLRFLAMIFPVFCLSISSGLNPFLYALRHPKIKKQLHVFGSHCEAVLEESFEALRQQIHTHSNPTQSPDTHETRL